LAGYICIASARGVDIKVPKYCWFSFFNSPYPAHKSCSAIDIYFPSGEALFPVDEGLVLEVERFECPVFRSDADGFDYLIIVKVADDVVLKILHVKPYVSSGDVLELGDCLGSLIVSGYFYSWSHRHMHVEIRSISDPYRALGAFKLDISPTVEMLSSVVDGDDFYVVDEVFDDYVWLKPSSDRGFISCGLIGRFNESLFHVDGGIPHYDYGAILGSSGISGKRVFDVYGGVIGEIYSSDSVFALFKPISQPFIDDFPVYGVGSYINNSRLKIVKPNGWPYGCGDIVKLNFRLNGEFNLGSKIH